MGKKTRSASSGRAMNNSPCFHLVHLAVVLSLSEVSRSFGSPVPQALRDDVTSHTAQARGTLAADTKLDAGPEFEYCKPDGKAKCDRVRGVRLQGMLCPVANPWTFVQGPWASALHVRPRACASLRTQGTTTEPILQVCWPITLAASTSPLLSPTSLHPATRR